MSNSSKIKIIIAIIGAVAVIAAAIISKLPELENGKDSSQSYMGEIIYPNENEVVGSKIDVRGRLNGIPKNHYVWITIQIGNLYWVKEPEIPANNQSWSITIFERYEEGRRFNISLLMVDESGNKFINSWLKTGILENHYPGIENIPGSTILDIVPVRME